MDRNAEIARIRHELDILRARYATYERWGRVLRIFFMIWTPLFFALAAALIVKAFMADPFMGGFFAVLAVVACLLLWLTRGPNSSLPFLRGRWVDAASSMGAGISLYPGVASVRLTRRSDAREIEDQIAERERRLAELGESS
jgi:cytochrome bd-type quinol oxidase subunit 2